MYCVGLTGNIASGKSTVAAYFAKLGVGIISADKIAKQLTSEIPVVLEDIVNHFGQTALTSTGELDRHYIRQLIFKSPAERLWLEDYLHPLIREQIKLQIPTIQSAYCIIEIPLLTDRAHYPYLNRVLLVETETEQRSARFTARDHGSKEDMLAILSTQPNQQTLAALADDILNNNGTLIDLKDKIKKLHVKYLRFSFNSI